MCDKVNRFRQVFFQKLDFDPSQRGLNAGQIGEVFDRGLTLGKAYDESGLDDKPQAPGRFSAQHQADGVKLSFDSTNTEVAGPSVTVAKTELDEHGEVAKVTSIRMGSPWPGKLKVHWFEALAGQSIDEAKAKTYIVDRRTGTIFQDLPVLSSFNSF